LPKWHAHNPLWVPIYLFILAVMLVQILSGLLLLNDITLLGNWSLRQSHLAVFRIIGIFTLLHIIASFFHDAKGDGGDISAMINGQRTFTVEPASGNQPQDIPGVSLDSLTATTKEFPHNS
jgi:Ni/Fe-hydrogenase 1 B-type cytochrome subunit